MFTSEGECVKIQNWKPLVLLEKTEDRWEDVLI